MLWTGGKDSALAFELCRQDCEIVRLVTFVPLTGQPFRAHPLAAMRAQAESIGLPHQCIEVDEPYRVSYVAAIRQLREEGVEVLITGDIAPVDGYPNWISECAEGICQVMLPLWAVPREQLLAQLQARGFEAVITLAYHRHFGADSPVGKPLDAAMIERFRAIASEPPFDLCGENGEYHSCVLDAPYFRWPVALTGARQEQTQEYDYLVWQGAERSEDPAFAG
ncbi:Dph6-related ATP pyrophosphatase [Marinobacterium arenosum]|uniref:Dph6-related ATP pyrophosphatase n=1 Tax=Marinobacterium arenosum TaxID=2862496 RepID=UPI001C965B37|nr:hypothetical protein [Marinobacterium arenosum]MBY4675869.1 hypothetical protein [Marinobacterium arenosum]